MRTALLLFSFLRFANFAQAQDDDAQAAQAAQQASVQAMQASQQALQDATRANQQASDQMTQQMMNKNPLPTAGVGLLGGRHNRC